MLSAYWPDPQTEAHERRNWISRKLERFNQWFDRQARRLHAASSAGRSTTGWRWWRSRRDRSSARSCCRRRSAASGSSPSPTAPSSPSRCETPPGSNLEYTHAQDGGGGASRARTPARCATPSRPSVPAAGRIPAEALGAVDLGSVYVRLVPKADRSISQEHFGEVLREEVEADRRRDGGGLHLGIRRRDQADPARAPWQRSARAAGRRRLGAPDRHAGCPAPWMWASRPRDRSRNSRSRSTVRSPASSA